MSDPAPDTLERLEGYEILPSPAGVDAATLILWTKTTRFHCILGRQTAQRLVAAVQKHAVERS